MLSATKVKKKIAKQKPPTYLLSPNGDMNNKREDGGRAIM